MDLDAELTEYDDAEARGGLRGELDSTRVEIRRRHTHALRAERRRTVIDLAGPGRDTVAFHRDGFDVTGVDVAPVNVSVLRSQGPPPPQLAPRSPARTAAAALEIPRKIQQWLSIRRQSVRRS